MKNPRGKGSGYEIRLLKDKNICILVSWRYKRGLSYGTNLCYHFINQCNQVY
jgi:hypothetical protein